MGCGGSRALPTDGVASPLAHDRKLGDGAPPLPVITERPPTPPPADSHARNMILSSWQAPTEHSGHARVRELYRGPSPINGGNGADVREGQASPSPSPSTDQSQSLPVDGSIVAKDGMRRTNAQEAALLADRVRGVSPDPSGPSYAGDSVVALYRTAPPRGKRQSLNMLGDDSDSGN